LKKLLGFIVIVFGLVFIYAPIIILAVYSFLDTPNIGAAGNFTLDNYITLFTTEELSQMIWGTVILALVSAVISTFLGTIGAIGTYYSRRRTQAFVNTVN
jgi:spermidine/putrescine transport system permease protein